MERGQQSELAASEVRIRSCVACIAVSLAVAGMILGLFGVEALSISITPFLVCLLAARPEVSLTLFVFAGVFKGHPMLELPLALDWTVLLGLSAVFSLFLRAVVLGRVSRIRLTKPDLLLSGFILTLAIGLLLTPDRGVAVRGFIELVVLGTVASYCLVRVVGAVADPEATVRNSFVTLLILGVALSIATLVRSGQDVRAFASSYLVWGYYLGVTAVVGGGLYSMSSGRMRWVIGSVLPLLIVAMVYSRARGPLIALLGTTLIMTFLHKRDIGKRLAVVVGILVVLLGTFLANPSLWGRYSLLFAEDRGASVNVRVDALRLAGKLFLAHPILGAGTGSFRYWAEIDPLGHGLSYPHNAMLQVLAENGLVGFSLYAGWILGMVVLYLRASRTPAASGRERLLLQTGFAGFVFLMLGQQFSGAIIGRHELFFAGLAVLLAARMRHSEHAAKARMIGGLVKSL